MLRWLGIARKITFTLSDSLEAFVANEIKSGAYSTSSEVILAGLRLLAEKRVALDAARDACNKGNASGIAGDFSWEGIKSEALRRAKGIKKG